MCGKPVAFRQAAQPKCFSVEPGGRKGRAFPHIRRRSRDFFTPPDALRGLKPRTIIRVGVARLKPCPDTLSAVHAQLLMSPCLGGGGYAWVVSSDPSLSNKCRSRAPCTAASSVNSSKRDRSVVTGAAWTGRGLLD